MTDEMPFNESVIANSKASQSRIYLLIYRTKLTQSILLILSEKQTAELLRYQQVFKALIERVNVWRMILILKQFSGTP